MVKKIDAKKKKLKKRQEKEKTRVQDTVQQIYDAVEFVNVGLSSGLNNKRPVSHE